MTRGIVVRNNVIVGNDKAGLVFGGYGKGAGRVEGCEFLNNLIRGNTGHKKAQAELWIQWASSNVVKNNIIVGGAGSSPLLANEGGGSGQNALDYNRWFSIGEGDERFIWRGRSFEILEDFQAAIEVDTHSSWGNPQLEDSGFEPSGGSPCIDAGDPVYRPKEGILDFGGAPRLVGERVDVGPTEVQ